MRERRIVDLSSHLNANVSRGNPAAFGVSLQPVYWGETKDPIPNRRAIVRDDTNEAVSVVSDRYALVPHTRVLDVVNDAIAPLDVGEVPRGIFVDSRGAQMRALYKFPALAKPIVRNDDICPCVQVRNTYDSTARISLHIGAFRFVCTNLAVGGGGAFAGGFVSIHAGDIPLEEMAGQLAAYLSRFDRIVETYRAWSNLTVNRGMLDPLLKFILRERFADLADELLGKVPDTVFETYNRLTYHATHSMRSARTAFEMLERVNSGFQKTFPATTSIAEDHEHEVAHEGIALTTA